MSTNPSLTPTQALNLRVVDPACGSGSFLLGAYQYLLDWHLNYYLTHDPQSHTRGKNPPLVATEGGEYRLTTETKKRILTASIHGVDIDSQAVEVTKLSLLLKLLEGETGQLSLGFERVLPDLGNNIRCGNSLVGTDYFKTTLFPDEEEFRRVNPFDWQPAFPVIFAAGGFDSVIGNPPYVRADSLGNDLKKYLEQYYLTFTSNADLYAYFLEKSLMILRRDGLFGMITSNKFIKTAYGKNLRNYINNFTKIEEILDFGELPVFTQAATFPAIIILKNNKVDSQIFNYYPIKSLPFQSLNEVTEHAPVKVSSVSMTPDIWILSDVTISNLISRLETENFALSEFLPNKINYGIKTALDDAFVVDRDLAVVMLNESPRAIEHIKPYLKGNDIRSYQINNERQKYLLLFKKGWSREMYGSIQERDLYSKLSREFPLIMNHLEKFRSRAQYRSDKGDYWWELRGCDYYDAFEKTKLVWPEIAKESRFALDDNGNYLNKTCFFTNIKDYYLLGILNSRLIWFYLKNVCSVLGDPDKGGRLMQQKMYVEKIPIVRPTEDNTKISNEIGELAFSLTQLFKTNEGYLDATGINGQYANLIQDSINQRVNLLYQLTDEEIRIVESNSQPHV